MKKAIPFILSLFILLPGCSNDDTIKIPKKEITKEKALNIFNSIDEKVNEYLKEIKDNEKSFYGIYEVEKYMGETLRDSKIECSVDFKNNEAFI